MTLAGEDLYREVAMEAAAGGPAAGRLLRLRIGGASMRPLIRPGDVVVLRPLTDAESDPARDLQPGGVVTFRQAGRVVTHRLVGRQEEGWICKGDNLRRPDEPVCPEAILGIVSGLERPGQPPRRSAGSLEPQRRGAAPVEDETPARRINLPSPRWGSLIARLSAWEGRLNGRVSATARLAALAARAVLHLILRFHALRQ